MACGFSSGASNRIYDGAAVYMAAIVQMLFLL